MDMNSLPILYKKTSTNAIQYWSISLVTKLDHAQIVTKYGQVGGKEQETMELVTAGKNMGKKNETSIYEQGKSQVQSMWDKKLKSGYVDSIEKAQNNEINSLIKGGVEPMLAHKYSEQAHKIKYPAFVQPKLDGIRAVAMLDQGKCTLWSRTRKQITSCQHICDAIINAYGTNVTVTLDGELYNHEYKKDFEKIVSLVRQEEPSEDSHLVQYHIYDMVIYKPFKDRNYALTNFLGLKNIVGIKLVQTEMVENEDELKPQFDKAISNGYEGLMIRNSNSAYVNKRSYDLQKMKEFDEEEFKIVGINEGKGKLAGHAIFICSNTDGVEFDVKLNGDTSYLKELYNNHDLWLNKKLTVQYQGLTGKNKVPRFPVGKAIRDYE